jgi:hypothetical protein
LSTLATGRTIETVSPGHALTIACPPGVSAVPC